MQLHIAGCWRGVQGAHSTDSAGPGVGRWGSICRQASEILSAHECEVDEEGGPGVDRGGGVLLCIMDKAGPARTQVRLLACGSDSCLPDANEERRSDRSRSLELA